MVWSMLPRYKFVFSFTISDHILQNSLFLYAFDKGHLIHITSFVMLREGILYRYNWI